MEPPYLIYPKGGLCARLKVLLSWKMRAVIENKKIICYWPKTRLCNGLFLNCFEPIPDISFLNEEPSPESRIDYEGDKPIGELDLHGLRPTADLMARINTNISFMHDFDAIHVRRTDFDAIVRQRTPDSEFFKFIDDGDGKTPIFLATDNMATQFMFAQKYNGLIRINRAMRNTAALRNSSLEDAVIDLFTCAAAKYFMGTKGSAFTDFIEALRSPDSPYSYQALTVKSIVIPEATQPEATQPEATQPEATQPEATQPSTEEVIDISPLISQTKKSSKKR